MRVEAVEHLGDPRVGDYRNVRDADLRAGSVFLAEGRLNVERLLASPRFRARSVFVTEAALRGIGVAIEGLEDDTPVYVAPRSVMNDVVGYDMHRGCLAAGDRGEEPTFDALLDALPAARLVVVLEHVTNPDNVGGIFRNALAFGADAVLLTGRCADPLYRKSLRVSMGATLRVPFARARAWPGELQRLRGAGFTVLAFGTGAGTEVLSSWQARPGARLALLFGTEGEGLSEAARCEADARLTIPMAPGVDSLNVATASGIALHHLSHLSHPSPWGRRS